MGEILLIAADWRLRALARAQLLEEGFQVRALPSLEAALAYVACGEQVPCLTVLDCCGIQAESRDLSDLWRLTQEAPLLLCGGALDRTFLEREDLPPARMLLRPFRVGDLVAEVRRMGAWPKGNASAK